MPYPAANPELSPSLSEWLECHFADWFEASQGAPPTPQMRQLWERAMLDPALAFLSRPGKNFRARMVARAWMLAGGGPDSMPAALPAVVEALHAGSLIVDDVQDEASERRGAPALHHLVGMPLAINTGNLLYCWALELLSTASLGAERELELYRRTVRTMLRCHQGQALDVSVRMFETPQYLIPSVVAASTDLKTGTLMELSSAMGAVAARADAKRVDALTTFGRALGNGLQMLDDLSGLLNPNGTEKAQVELRLARPTWAWAWLAMDLEPDDFDSLQQEGRAVADGQDPSGLIQRMALALDVTGRQRVHQHLEESLDEVQRSIGPSSYLVELRQEVEQLERSYV
jgi:geranylgeranyl pyrophosphate synthase